MRRQFYALLAVSLLFSVSGTVWVLIDRSASVIALPFMAVGILGLLASSAVAQLAERVERLERAHTEQGQASAAAETHAGQGSA
jgi:hypothetical protein